MLLTFILCACLYQKFNLGSLYVTEKKSNFIFTWSVFFFFCISYKFCLCHLKSEPSSVSPCLPVVFLWWPTVQQVVLDLWIMIYYPIKSTSPPYSQKEGESEERKLSVNCCSGTFLWWALCSFSLPSNPSLGSVESPVSILLPGLIKHGHTATGSLASPHWTAKVLWLRSCKRSRAHAHTPRGLSQLEFILGNLNAPFILIGHCKSLFYYGEGERLQEACRGTVSKMRAIRQRTERNKVSKWVLSLTGLLEAPDVLLWFVTAWFQLCLWETFKHTYTHRSCGERLSAYLFGERSKWFPLPSYSQTLNC